MSLPLAGERLVIAHLFADLLNLYGDRGNIEVLVRRASWRGVAVEVRPIGIEDGAALSGVDLIFIGGGQDREQVAVAAGLDRLGGPLREAVAAGAALLAVCGGYQNLGHRYSSDLVGDLRGPGILDIWTEAPSGATRLVGGVLIDLPPESPIAAIGRSSAAAAGRPAAAGQLVGFENHSGRTYLGPGARPLGRTRVGHGNSDDGYEGALALPGEGGLAGLRIGTYLHGPLLPRNPHLADYLLACGLARRGVSALPALEDGAEWQAHAAFAEDWLAIREAGRSRSRVGRAVERLGNLIGF